MALVLDLLNNAFGHLRVIAVGETLEASEASLAIGVLNSMMARLEANGIALGWSPVANVAETLPVPDQAIEPLGYLLASRLRSRYGVALDPDVVEGANTAMSQLRRDQMRATPLEWDRTGSRYDIVTDSYV